MMFLQLLNNTLKIEAFLDIFEQPIPLDFLSENPKPDKPKEGAQKPQAGADPKKPQGQQGAGPNKKQAGDTKKPGGQQGGDQNKPKAAEAGKPQAQQPKPQGGKPGAQAAQKPQSSSSSMSSTMSQTKAPNAATNTAKLKLPLKNKDTVVKVSFNNDLKQTKPIVKVLKSEDDYKDLLALIKTNKEPREEIAQNIIKNIDKNTEYKVDDEKEFKASVMKPEKLPNEFWGTIQGKNGKEKVLFKIQTVTVLANQDFDIKPTSKSNNNFRTVTETATITKSIPYTVEPQVQSASSKDIKVDIVKKNTKQKVYTITSAINDKKKSKNNDDTKFKWPSLYNFQRGNGEKKSDPTHSSVTLNAKKKSEPETDAEPETKTKTISTAEVTGNINIEKKNDEIVSSITKKSLSDQIFGSIEDKNNKEKKKEEETKITAEIEKKAKENGEKQKPIKPEIRVDTKESGFATKTIEIFLTVNAKDIESTKEKKESTTTTASTTTAAKDTDKKIKLTEVNFQPTKPNVEESEIIIQKKRDAHRKSSFGTTKITDNYIKGEFEVGGYDGKKTYKFKGVLDDID